MNPSGYPGSSEASAPGFSVAPPPPPPPPIAGQVPALRINTVSEPGPRKPLLNPNDPYEPPAAIQNAMMTKDKKPFTYTPGMGGKLDLSQIRSPRMARRVAKNANDEGIEGPPKSALAQEPKSPSTPQPNMYSHPAVAVPVFPQGMPQQQTPNLRNSTLPRSPPVVERVQVDPTPRPTIKVETKMLPSVNSPDVQTPTPPTSPTQVTLAKAPTPWMQKSVKQQEELPEWAKRANNRSQDSSSGSDSPQQQQPPQVPRQIVVVNSPRQQQQSQPQMRPVRQENDRVVPIRIEDRPSVFSALNEPGHHQLANTTPHHQSRWGNPVGMSAPVQQSQGGSYIVPMQVDGQQQNNFSSPANGNHNSMQYNQGNRITPRAYVPPSNQPEPGPIQSSSFRVLQKITGTDPDQIDGEQIRKLQLTEDDRCLMNKFKEQVDSESQSYLHKEEDPRYRGAAIPSRAFRYLQNMTDSGDVSNTNSTPRTVNSAIKKQNRNSKNFDEVQIPVQIQQPTQYIPPSEQQVPEPKKYTGGAIPSRSFRILQAMTAPESIATQVMQENREDSATDFVNMPDNQQGVYYSAYPHVPFPIPPPVASSTYWNPENIWWTYYPIPPYPTYDPYQHPYYYYHPPFYSYNGTGFIEANDPNAMTQISFDNNYCASELNDNNSDECMIAFHGNPLSRNSALYVGSQWRYDSSSTPTSCTTTTTEKSDKIIEDQPLTSSSQLHSSSSESDSEREVEGEEEEDSSCSSSKRNDDEEQNASAESSDSSCDSDSYLAYSTGLNPLKPREKLSSKEDIKEDVIKKEDIEDNDSTDCEKENLSEDNLTEEEDEEDNEDDEEDKTSTVNDQEDINNTTVSVSLPLRFKFSVSDKNEDVTTVIVGDSTIKRDIDTYVNFTLKKPNQKSKEKTVQESQETTQEQTKPTFVVTATDTDTEDKTEVSKIEVQEEQITPRIEDKRKTLLSVQSHSREEVTDDDDSGVTSDMSRIISEVDTDSECYLTASADNNPVAVKKSGNNKYQRTQTHSRLFKLLSDEQLRLPSIGSNLSNHEEHSSNSSGLNSPDYTLDPPMDHHDFHRSSRYQLPTRPKSLDCEALFKRHQDNQPDSYYQTWKNGDRSPSKSPVNNNSKWTYPRVFCPRIRSTKNVPQTIIQKNHQQLSRMKSPLGSNMISSSTIPSPLRTSKHC